MNPTPTRLMFVCLVAALAGCAARPAPHEVWERPETTPEQVALDHRACELEVEQAAHGEAFDNPAMKEPSALEDLRERRWRRDRFYRCMVDRGYRLH